MKHLLALAALFFSCAASAQVTISQDGALKVANPIAATFNAAYTYSVDNTSVNILPLATGDLAAGTFLDSMSYSGTAYCVNCSGGLAIYLPTLSIADSFIFKGSAGNLIPWTLSMVETPVFGPASSNVFSDVIYNTFSVGGNVVGSNVSTCFSINGGCGVIPVASPNNTPYRVTVSGTIASGGILDFNSTTSGASNFIRGPVSAGLNDSMALDPLISLSVPAGVSVVSASGVFPITAVPEPAEYALLLVGAPLLSFFARRRKHGD